MPEWTLCSGASTALLDQEPAIEFDDFMIDPSARRVFVSGEEEQLTQRE